MKKKLKKGGIIYTGIGPLYNSFYGDHKLTKSILPWGHVILPDTVLIRRINRTNRKKNLKLIKKIQDLGLNKLSFAEYKRIIYNSGLEVKYFRINHGNPLLRIFSLFRRIPFLEEYFTYNIYFILRKK